MLFFYFFITAFATTLAGSVRSNGETNVNTTDDIVTALDGKQTGHLMEILLNQELSQKVQLVQNVVQLMNDVQALKQEDNRLKTENLDLRMEVQTLKREDNRLKTENVDLRREVMTNVQTLKQEDNRLKTENVDLRTAVMTDVHTLKQEVNRLNTENLNLRREVGNVSSKVADNSRRITQNADKKTPIAFYAYFSTHFKPLRPGQGLIFDSVETNLGNGYNNTTGLFTAPASGLYAFTRTLLADGAHVAGSSGDYGEMAGVLKQNGVAKGWVAADTETEYDEAASTGFVLLNVRKGDRIQIVVGPWDGQGSMRSDSYGRTTFSGFQIN